MTIIPFPIKQSPAPSYSAIKSEVINGGVLLTITFPDGSVFSAPLTADEAALLGDWLINDALAAMMNSPIASPNS